MKRVSLVITFLVVTVLLAGCLPVLGDRSNQDPIRSFLDDVEVAVTDFDAAKTASLWHYPLADAGKYTGYGAEEMAAKFLLAYKDKKDSGLVINSVKLLVGEADIVITGGEALVEGAKAFVDGKQNDEPFTDTIDLEPFSVSRKLTAWKFNEANQLMYWLIDDIDDTEEE